MNRIITELRRRNVIKAGISYLVVAWVLLQVAAIIIPMFGLSRGLEKWVFIALLIGLPIWIVFAYIYELTPSGFKKTDDLDASESIRDNTSKKLNGYIITGLSLAVILLVFDRFYQIDVSREVDAYDRSIAVLPFENISASEDAYFAEGMTEDILTQISKITDLRVLSSLSMNDYESKGKSPEQIGQELGVSYILIGNVRRSNNESELRIGCQLVDTKSAGTVWAQTYDKQMINMFAIQSEIAIEIASSLNATISEKEEINIEIKPTENLAAYDFELKGRELSGNFSKEANERAVTFYKEAIALDPFFSTAYARLASAYAIGYQNYGNHGRNYLDTALVLAQKAIDLSPDFSVNWGALGVTYSVMGKIDQAIPMIEKQLELSPNSTTALNNLSTFYSESGDHVKAIEYLKRAMDIAPNNYSGRFLYYANLSNSYWQVGLFDRAVAATEASLEVEESPAGLGNLAIILYQKGDSTGAINAMERLLALDPESTVNLYWMVLFHTEYMDLEKGKGYLERLKASPSYDLRDYPNLMIYEAYKAFDSGDNELGNSILQNALDFYLSEIQKGVQFQYYLKDIASIYAVQGDQGKAIEWLERLFDTGYLNLESVQHSLMFKNLAENEDYLDLLGQVQMKKDSLKELIIRAEMNSTLRMK